MIVTTADELCETDAERASLAALRDIAGADAPVMVAHCQRQFLIAERLAGGEPYDRELLLCACWLHDAGVWMQTSRPYVTEGAALAERVLRPLGWSGERLQRCMDACEQHHAPTSRRSLGFEVELVRRSDLVEVSHGLVNFGLERRWIGELARAIPRTGFIRLLNHALVGELRHRPKTIYGVVIAPPAQPPSA